MKSKQSSSQTYNGLVNLQINKSSLEKAEETLILDLKNRALREWKSQLQTMNNKKVGAPFNPSSARNSLALTYNPTTRFRQLDFFRFIFYEYFILEK